MSTTTPKMKRFNYFLAEDQHEALTRAAARRRVSRSQLLRDILDRVFKLTPPTTTPDDEPASHAQTEAGQ
jgi:hypothetical protein